MMNLKNEHIVQLIDVCEDEEYVYLIEEYCNGGDLLDLQAKQPNKIFSL